MGRIGGYWLFRYSGFLSWVYDRGNGQRRWVDGSESAGHSFMTREAREKRRGEGEAGFLEGYFWLRSSFLYFLFSRLYGFVVVFGKASIDLYDSTLEV